MSDTLKVTMIQTQLHWENAGANIEMFSEKISELKETGDIIVLPEMFSTGFSMNTAIAETMDGKAVRWMAQTAKEKNCVVTGSLMMRDSISSGGHTVDAFFNRLIWMRSDGTYEMYNKRHLFALAHEEKNYTAGNKKLIVEYKGWRIHPLICYDLRYPVWSRRTKKDDYDLLIYCANWPERRVIAWGQLLIARAIENQCYVVGVNRVGNDGNKIYHSGDSAIVDFRGEVMNNACADETCMETIALSKKELDEFRKQLPFIEGADDFTIN